jgi:hydrogenase-4 component F
MLLYTLIILPLLGAALTLLARPATFDRIFLISSAILHAAVVGLCWLQNPAPALGGWLALDPLGLIFLTITSVLFLLAAIYTIGYLRSGPHGNENVFIASLQFFLAAMTLVTMSQHVGLLWVAIEATTLTSAPLIYFHRSPSSLEAMWKYLMICSVGIGLALLGTLFLGVAASRPHGAAVPMVLNSLAAQANSLDPTWLKIAFLFLLIGYGTKMGLAPLHTWLPDAHSEAPSPASALLSGALLNCAFLGILRFYQICAAAGLADFVRELLVLFGLLSLGVAAAFIVGQSDFKRMLAYSSVEHMGILSLGVGLGGAGVYGALLHAVNHSLAKGLLFLVAGNILLAYQTKEMARVHGLRQRLPVTAILLLAGFLAITGSPPFGLFLSEFTILKSALDARQTSTAALYLLFLAVAFVGMAAAVLKMGAAADHALENKVNTREPIWLIASPLVLTLMLLMLGLYIPAPLQDLLGQAANILGVPK